MGCRRLRTNEIKERAETKIAEYDEVFLQELIDKLSEVAQVEDVAEVVENWENSLPDPDEWAQDQVVIDYKDYCESQYEAERDDALTEG